MIYDNSNEDHRDIVHDMADGVLKDAMSEGDVFSEDLNNWAINKALREFE